MPRTERELAGGAVVLGCAHLALSVDLGACPRVARLDLVHEPLRRGDTASPYLAWSASMLAVSSDCARNGLCTPKERSPLP